MTSPQSELYAGRSALPTKDNNGIPFSSHIHRPHAQALAALHEGRHLGARPRPGNAVGHHAQGVPRHMENQPRLYGDGLHRLGLRRPHSLGARQSARFGAGKRVDPGDPSRRRPVRRPRPPQLRHKRVRSDGNRHCHAGGVEPRAATHARRIRPANRRRPRHGLRRHRHGDDGGRRESRFVHRLSAVRRRIVSRLRRGRGPHDRHIRAFGALRRRRDADPHGRHQLDGQAIRGAGGRAAGGIGDSRLDRLRRNRRIARHARRGRRRPLQRDLRGPVRSGARRRHPRLEVPSASACGLRGRSGFLYGGGDRPRTVDDVRRRDQPRSARGLLRLHRVLVHSH